MIYEGGVIGLWHLTVEDFKEMERLGRCKLAPAVRAGLIMHLRQFDSSHIDLLVWRSRIRPLHKGSTRPQRLRHLIQGCAQLLAKFETERWTIYHRNALTESYYLPFERKIRDCLRDALRTLEETEPYAAENQHLQRRKRGRKPNYLYLELLFGVADAYRDAGGRVSAAAQLDKGRNSPFMRFFQYLNNRLPREQRLSSNALAEWAHRTGIPAWKASQQG